MNVNQRLLKLIIILLMLLVLLLLLLWLCLLLLITLYFIVINECCSEAHRGCCWVSVVVGGWVGGVCKVIFVSSPTTVLRLCYVVLWLGLWQYICHHSKHERKNSLKLNYWGQWISHIMKICAEYSGTFQGLIQASMVFQAQQRMFQSCPIFFLKIKAPYCSLGHLLTE